MPVPLNTYKFTSERITAFMDFITERQTIWYKRFVLKKPKPWTDNPILLKYRFCNVYRELDTVTLWIADNWRQPHSHDPNLWFAMVVARYINWHPSLDAIGFPVPWRPKFVLKKLYDREDAGEKVFTGAYMISQAGTSLKKADYVTNHVLTPVWQRRAEIMPQSGESLAGFYKKLSKCHGLGSGFMSGQVIADIKYAKPLSLAKDWDTFAVSGPGSRRGLNRMLNRHPDTAWNDKEWHTQLLILRNIANSRIKENPIFMEHGLGLLHAQDTQSGLCEFDKYERVRKHEGRPRSTYPGEF